MDDLISRKSVIEKVNKLDNCEKYDRYNLGLWIAREIIKHEPSAQQWIPCSKRLPEEFADVICCTDAEEIFIATYLGKLNDGEDCFDDNEGMMWDGDVIAWMPLPPIIYRKEKQ